MREEKRERERRGDGGVAVLTRVRGRVRQRIDALEAQMRDHVLPGRGSATGEQEGTDAPQPVARPTRARALVIVLGLQRGNSAAWASLARHVLDPLGADLAIYSGASEEKGLLHAMAKHTWTFDDSLDWEAYLERATRLCANATSDHAQVMNKSYVCSTTFGGGFKGCSSTNGAILLLKRWLLALKLRQLDLFARYDYFILTRADHVHMCDHPPLEQLDANALHVLPQLETCRDYCDTYAVASRCAHVRPRPCLYCPPQASKEVGCSLGW